MRRTMKMPFGKYEGQDIVDIPIEYLKWLEEKSIFPDLRKAINEELLRRVDPSHGRNCKIISAKDQSAILSFIQYVTINDPSIAQALAKVKVKFFKEYEVVK